MSKHTIEDYNQEYLLRETGPAAAGPPPTIIAQLTGHNDFCMCKTCRACRWFYGMNKFLEERIADLEQEARKNRGAKNE